MANTASAKKATRKIARRADINRDRRSRMRTVIRKVEDPRASAAGQPEILPAAAKGGGHRNTASRRVPRLHARVKALSA